MRCPKCGKKVKKYDVICQHCGEETRSLLPPDEVIAPEGESKVTMTPPEKPKFKLFLILAIASVFVLLSFFVFLFGELSPKNASFSFAPKTVGDTVFYNSGFNFVSYNLATEKTQGSLYIKDGKPISFAVFGNDIYYILESTLCKTDYSLEAKNHKTLCQNVNAAVIANGEIYYVSENNPSQLRKCDLNGKNDILVTLIFDDKNPASQLYFANGKIYVLKAKKLYCFDIAKEEMVLVLNGEYDVVNVNFYKDNGLFVYNNGTNHIRLLDETAKDYDISLSAAAICANDIYGAIITENGITLGRVNLKNGKLEEIFSLKNHEGLKIVSFDADKKFIWLTVSKQDGEAQRYGVYRISLNGEVTVLHSDL